jgi:hypothetical protein
VCWGPDPDTGLENPEKLWLKSCFTTGPGPCPDSPGGSDPDPAPYRSVPGSSPLLLCLAHLTNVMISKNYNKKNINMTCKIITRKVHGGTVLRIRIFLVRVRIRIRPLGGPDADPQMILGSGSEPDPQTSGSGSGRMLRTLADPDPQLGDRQ